MRPSEHQSAGDHTLTQAVACQRAARTRRADYRHWVTDLYTTAGGINNSRGRGATWDEALFVGALLHLRADDRNGRPRQIAVKARELEGWLFPSGQMPHPGRDWHKLPEALQRVDQMRIYLPSIDADVRVVAIDSIPKKRDGCVAFRLVFPSGSAHGPRIDWPTLVRYRSQSGPAYRAYLASQVILDHTARNGRPVPSYTARDLADIIAIQETGRAVKAFRQLHEDGIIELVEERHGRSHAFRIYGQPPDSTHTYN